MHALLSHMGLGEILFCTKNKSEANFFVVSIFVLFLKTWV